MKRFISLALCVVLLTMTCLSASGAADPKAAAFSKTEVVYANLNPDGSNGGIYVVNIFDVTSPGTIIDYGDYGEVKNLTSGAVIANSSGEVSVNAENGNFYYQGNLTNDIELPWSFEIAYSLNGVPVSPEDLVSQSGVVGINLTITSNGEWQSICDSYMLQISMSIDSDKCEILDNGGATTAVSGSDRLLTFVMLPGNEQTFEVRINATDFEMDGISIAALPYSMDYEIPDISGFADSFAELTDAVGRLRDGAVSLKSGTAEMQKGLAQLTSGSETYKQGIDALGANGAELVTASKNINAALSQLKGAMAMLDPQTLAMLPPELTAALSGVSGGLESLGAQYGAFHSGLESYTNGVGEAAKGYAGVNSGIKELADGAGKLKNGMSELADGLDTLAENTDDLPGRIEDEINGLISDFETPAFTPVSFTSPKNNTSAVQFVIRTAAITKPAAIKEPVEVEKDTFWSRITKLFG